MSDAGRFSGISIFLWNKIAEQLGLDYSFEQYGLNEMLDALTDAIFEADISASVNTLRQQLQGEYLDQLLAILAENSETGHTQVGRSAVMGQVLRVEDMLGGRPASDASTLFSRPARSRR